MNYYKKNLQKKAFTKQSFSAKDLLEDVRNLSRSSRSSREVISVYSDMVTSLVHFSQIKHNVDEYESAFLQAFRDTFDEVKSIAILKNLKSEVSPIYNSFANGWIRTKINTDISSMLDTPEKYLQNIYQLGRYSVYYICCAYFAKNKLKPDKDSELSFKEIYQRMREIDSSLGLSPSLSAIETVIAGRFGVNKESIRNNAGLKNSRQEFMKLKGSLLKGLQEILKNLMPEFPPYLNFLSRNMNRLQLSHKEFLNFYKGWKTFYEKLVNDIGEKRKKEDEKNKIMHPFPGPEVEPLGDTDYGTLSAKSLIGFLKKNAVSESENPPVLEPYKEPSDESEESPIEKDEDRFYEEEKYSIEDLQKYGINDPKVVEDFLQRFDPSGESFLQLEFLGQAIIESAMAQAALDQEQGSNQLYNKAADLIIKRIQGYSGRAYSKLALSMTIVYQLSN